jgi:hypothetical protein
MRLRETLQPPIRGRPLDSQESTKTLGNVREHRETVRFCFRFERAEAVDCERRTCPTAAETLPQMDDVRECWNGSRREAHTLAWPAGAREAQ